MFKMLLFKGGVLIYAEHCIYNYIAKSTGSPLLMNRFDNFSSFQEYKS